MGDVMGDLSSRRGHIEGMEPRGNAQVIRGKVPLGKQVSGTQRIFGPGRRVVQPIPLQFKAYEPVPKSIAEEIVTKVRG